MITNLKQRFTGLGIPLVGGIFIGVTGYSVLKFCRFCLFCTEIREPGAQ